MKRIALCLYGKFNNRLSATSGVEGFEYIKAILLKNRNIDVFVHSWDIENQNQIEQLYGKLIKDSIFEPQKDFSPVIKEAGIDETKYNIPGEQAFRTISNSLSFFYTRGKALELKKKYEQQNNFKYDAVICSRFDLGQMDKYNGYQDYKVSEIVFDENYDMSFFYSAMWNQFNAGFTDMWFYSSSENMDILAQMYQRSIGYFSFTSDYVKALTTGWPDSNANDEFSNELLKEKKSIQLKTYPAADAHNNHIMHKWFLIDTGLYQKCKFVSTLSTRFCSVMYSHSDYSDIWPLYFGQIEKHSRVMGPKFLFVNKKMENVPASYEQIIYDETKSYPERVAQCLTVLKSRGFEACLFEHEDMILYKDLDYGKLKNIINLVLKPRLGKPFRNGFDCIRLIKASQTYSVRTISDKYVRWMLPFSKWLYSVQPTVWKIDSFINMLSKHYGESIWNLELKSQKTCRLLNLKCGYAHENGIKRGLHHWDSSIYPYVATAIVKGKWNVSEYSPVLPDLLNHYGIDVKKRGFV